MSLFESKKQAECCPECGEVLQIRRGKQGLFLGCSAYPKCHYLKPLHQTAHIIKTLDEPCPKCTFPLQLKQGSFGIFIGCSYYPECDFTVQDEPETEAEFDCPECKKHKLVQRTGRSGKHFYGCAGYPKCKFTLSTKPVLKSCPQCQCTLAVPKKKQYQCVNKACQFLFSDEPTND